MCDYSLAHYPHRLAVDGEQLLFYRFESSMLSLAPAGSTWREVPFRIKKPAVCVPPGSRLLLRDIPEHLQRRLRVGAAEQVTFVQLSAEALVYRDAVRFANGREILLHRLHCRQLVDVLNTQMVEVEEIKQSEAVIVASRTL